MPSPRHHGGTEQQTESAEGDATAQGLGGPGGNGGLAHLAVRAGSGQTIEVTRLAVRGAPHDGVGGAVTLCCIAVLGSIAGLPESLDGVASAEAGAVPTEEATALASVPTAKCRVPVALIFLPALVVAVWVTVTA